jgi:hypothetical protein
LQLSEGGVRNIRRRRQWHPPTTASVAACRLIKLQRVAHQVAPERVLDGDGGVVLPDEAGAAREDEAADRRRRRLGRGNARLGSAMACRCSSVVCMS